jgi:hypothetical protein
MKAIRDHLIIMLAYISLRNLKSRLPFKKRGSEVRLRSIWRILGEVSSPPKVEPLW